MVTLLIYNGSETNVKEFIKIIEGLWAALQGSSHVAQVHSASAIAPLENFMKAYSGISGHQSAEIRFKIFHQIMSAPSFQNNLASYCIRDGSPLGHSSGLNIIYDVYTVCKELHDEADVRVYFHMDEDRRVSVFNKKFNSALTSDDVLHLAINCDSTVDAVAGMNETIQVVDDDDFKTLALGIIRQLHDATTPRIQKEN